MSVQFNQVNVISRDMDASRAFYAVLGVAVSDAFGLPEGGGLHAEAEMANGTTVEFDDVASANTWAPHWPSPGAVVLGFAVDTSEEVDAAYERVTGAGYRGIEPPFDAFWGSRYAIVADPDGNAVGIMGPRRDR